MDPQMGELIGADESTAALLKQHGGLMAESMLSQYERLTGTSREGIDAFLVPLLATKMHSNAYSAAHKQTIAGWIESRLRELGML